MRSLSERLFSLRNRVLSAPRFQRWAASFPVTRLVARRRAHALFDLCVGFVYSQVLQAVIRLRLLEMLVERPLTLAELAPRLGLPCDAADRLLEAAASLKLVERRKAGSYGLGVHGAALIGNPAIRGMVEHHALLYRDLQDPVALLRGGVGTELGRFWSYANPRRGQPTEAEAAAYSELMASSLALIAEDILDSYPYGQHRCLLDVAGGEGAFLVAAGARAPHLSLMLFELPPVARLARDRIARAGLAARTSVVAGNLFTDPLPPGADLAILLRVILDHDDSRALHILRAVRQALRPGGALLLAEPMRGTAGAEAAGDAYFGFYLLAMGQGRPRSSEHLCALLLEAGFDRARSRRTRRPMLSRLIVAEVR